MVTVLTIGGSVLSGPHVYGRAAAFGADRVGTGAGERLLVTLSLRAARAIYDVVMVPASSPARPAIASSRSARGDRT